MDRLTNYREFFNLAKNGEKPGTKLEVFAKKILNDEFVPNDEGFGEVDCAQLCSIVKKTEVTARIFNAIFARLLAKLYTAEKYDDVFRILDIYFLFLTLKLLNRR